jgi:uncharacterized membrane protein YqaE (UPF0057 family)
MKKSFLGLLICLLLGGWNSPLIASSISTEEDSAFHSQKMEIRTAVGDFRALPRKERKQRVREAGKLWKEHQANAPSAAGDEIVFLAILAVLLPPVAVLLKEKKVNKRFWICLLLSLLFLLPGIVYALLIVFGVIQ